MSLHVYEVTIEGMEEILAIEAPTAAKARWQAVRRYWRAVGKKAGWPRCKSRRIHNEEEEEAK